MQNPSIKLVLARHGTTDWNLQKRYLGHSDIPLNEQGKDEARILGQSLSAYSFDAVYSSNLSRAVETANIVIEMIGEKIGKRTPLFVDARLREMDFGHIEGLTYEEAMAEHPTSMKEWYKQVDILFPPGGRETNQTVLKRMKSFFEELESYPYRLVCIVAHGGSIRAWLADKMEKPFWEIDIKHGQHLVLDEEGSERR